MLKTCLRINLNKKFIFFEMEIKKKIEMYWMIKMVITFKIYYTNIKIVFTFLHSFSFRNLHRLESCFEVSIVSCRLFTWSKPNWYNIVNDLLKRWDGTISKTNLHPIGFLCIFSSLHGPKIAYQYIWRRWLISKFTAPWNSTDFEFHSECRVLYAILRSGVEHIRLIVWGVLDLHKMQELKKSLGHEISVGLF